MVVELGVGRLVPLALIASLSAACSSGADDDMPAASCLTGWTVPACERV